MKACCMALPLRVTQEPKSQRCGLHLSALEMQSGEFRCGSAVMNLTGIHEDAGLMPGLGSVGYRMIPHAVAVV